MAYVVTTVLDLLTLVAKGVGAIGQNENLSSDEANDLLLLLNDMIDSWSIQKQFIYTVQRQPFTIGSLKQVYTMGAGGDFNIPRPPRIESVFVQLPSSGSTSELPMDLVDYDRWSQITVKGTDSSLARTCWPDYQYPLINISFWPIPNATQTFIFYVWQAISEFISLTAQVALPLGYRRAIRYNLQMEAYAHYGRDADPAIQNLASDSKAEIKRINKKVLLMQCDPALVASNRRGFNWLTGETT